MKIEEARKFLDGELLAITLEYGVSSETQKKRLESKFAALNLAVGAIDKQIPKKPNRGVCPSCGSRHIYAATLTKAECFKFCGNCGQALDWSDEDD